MIDPITAIEICRFLHDSALLLLWGSAAFLAFLTPKDLREATWRGLGMIPLLAAMVSALTTFISLPLETASIGDGWPDTTNLDSLRAILFESSVGFAWQIQAAAAILLLLAFTIPAKHRISAVAITSALALASLTLNGHASYHQGWLSPLHRGNDILHLLSGGGWLGALIPLVMMLQRLSEVNHQVAAQIALRRFSTTGHLAVALVVATGLVNTLLVLGHLPTAWNSPYQRMLIIKMAAVCFMIGLALLNRYCFVPAMVARGPAAVGAIRIGSIAEIAIGLVVIALVSVFGMLDPV